MITIILVLIIIGAVTIFSIQNSKPIEVSFLLWNFKASQAIIIFLSMLTGVVATIIIVFSRYIKRSVKKQNKPSG